MPVFQVNLWVCEVCGKTASTSVETSPYSDPVVSPPSGEEWEYITKAGSELLACPLCQVEKTMENEKPRCTVRGSLRGGRAMCGYVIVGGEFCSLKRGECNLQDGAAPGSANGVQADAMEDDGGSRAGAFYRRWI